jgi:hypothetical protein
VKLLSNFFSAALFKGISAAARGHACDHEQDRHALHPLILESEPSNARALNRSRR